MRPKLQYKQEKRQRNSLYASDYQKLEADIILELQSVEPTNPPLWNNTLRMEAGKAIELQMLNVLKENGIIDKDYCQESLPTTEIEREGVKIRMRFDAVSKKYKQKTTPRHVIQITNFYLFF